MEELEVSVSDEILKGLTGKVAEMGAGVNELTAEIKRANEQGARLPLMEKRLDAMGDWARKIEQGVQTSGEGIKVAVSGLEGRIGGLGERIVELAGKVSIPAEEMEGLRRELIGHAGLFEKPLRKEVYYRHFLGWPVCTVGGSVVLAVWMFMLWVGVRGRLAQAEGNDIKFRFVRLSSDSSISARVEAAERGWEADPDEFRKLVEADENMLWENYSNYRRKMQLDSETRAVKGVRGR